MAIEWRLALGALAIGLALVVAGLLQGCADGDEPTDGARTNPTTRETGPAAETPPLGNRYDSSETLPSCPDRTRRVNFDHATIVAGGSVVRLFYATSSSYVPCGFAAGDNEAVMVLELRATNPRTALADLNGRCVDAVLRSPAKEDLHVMSTQPQRGLRWSQEARAAEVGPDGDCPDVRPIPRATIDVD
jgi:hypothetical protein